MNKTFNRWLWVLLLLFSASEVANSKPPLQKKAIPFETPLVEPFILFLLQ
jgi:gamma-glutamylcysteine synthetase